MTQCPYCGRSFRDEAATRIEQLEAEAAEDERTIDSFGMVSPEQYQKELAVKAARIEQLESALRPALVELLACSVQLNARKDGSVAHAIEGIHKALAPERHST